MTVDVTLYNLGFNSDLTRLTLYNLTATTVKVRGERKKIKRTLNPWLWSVKSKKTKQQTTELSESMLRTTAVLTRSIKQQNCSVQ